MGEKTELSQVLQLWNALHPLSETGRRDYLARHPELPCKVTEQTLPLLREEDEESALPPLDDLLSECEASTAEKNPSGQHPEGEKTPKVRNGH